MPELLHCQSYPQFILAVAPSALIHLLSYDDRSSDMLMNVSYAPLCIVMGITLFRCSRTDSEETVALLCLRSVLWQYKHLVTVALAMLANATGRLLMDTRSDAISDFSYVLPAYAHAVPRFIRGCTVASSSKARPDTNPPLKLLTILQLELEKIEKESFSIFCTVLKAMGYPSSAQQSRR